MSEEIAHGLQETRINVEQTTLSPLEGDTPATPVPTVQTVCLCGWTSETRATEQDARADFDAHLAEVA